MQEESIRQAMHIGAAPEGPSDERYSNLNLHVLHMPHSAMALAEVVVHMCRAVVTLLQLDQSGLHDSLNDSLAADYVYNNLLLTVIV